MVSSTTPRPAPRCPPVRDRIDHFGAQFGCQLRQILVVDLLEIVGIGHLIEKGSRRHGIDWQLCHAEGLRSRGSSKSRDIKCGCPQEPASLNRIDMDCKNGFLAAQTKSLTNITVPAKG